MMYVEVCLRRPTDTLDAAAARYSLSPGVIADTCICSVSQLFATLH